MPHDRPMHSWDVTAAQAVAVQREFAGRLIEAPLDFVKIHTVAGLDVSANKGSARVHAAIVVLEFPSLERVDQATVTLPGSFPYIPGLLSFREGPPVLAVFEKLHVRPDLLIFDGQGYAHPRRLGLAAHLGLWLDLPSIGCGKTRLTGAFETPPSQRGAWTRLLDRGETIGAALVTRAGTKPVFVSRGHRCDLPSAIEAILRCSPRFRISEPVRRAHALCNAERLYGRGQAPFDTGSGEPGSNLT